MIDKYTVRPGDILWMDTSRTGRELVKVLKINQKNLKVETQAGQVWNCPPVFLTETTAADAASFTAAPAGTALVLGQTVRFVPGTGLARKCKYDLLVVVGASGDKYRLAPLGGDQGRYYRGIASADLEVVPFSLTGV